MTTVILIFWIHTLSGIYFYDAFPPMQQKKLQNFAEKLSYELPLLIVTLL